MKNLFGICFVKVKGGEECLIDSAPFATASLSEQQQRLLQEGFEEIDSLQKKGHLPVWLQIVKVIAGTGIFLCALDFVSRLLEVGFQQTIDELWVMLLFALLLLIIYLPLMVLQRKCRRELAKTLEDSFLMERAESLYKSSRQQLGIPDDAQEVDVISTAYQLKNGREKTLYTQNISVSMYHQSECLCFSDIVQIYSIPLSSIQKVVWVKKRLLLPEWNKEETYNSQTYKPYRIKKNNVEQYIIRGYYSLRISEVRGVFEVMVPEYDEKILFSLLPSQIPKEGF